MSPLATCRYLILSLSRSRRKSKFRLMYHSVHVSSLCRWNWRGVTIKHLSLLLLSLSQNPMLTNGLSETWLLSVGFRGRVPGYFSVYSSVCLVHAFPTGKVDCAERQVFDGRVPRWAQTWIFLTSTPPISRASNWYGVLYTLYSKIS